LKTRKTCSKCGKRRMIDMTKYSCHECTYQELIERRQTYSSVKNKVHRHK